MITNPIIPIWLMTILSMVAIIFVIYNKQIKDIISNKKEGKITDRQKKLVIRYIINSCIKVCIIILLFIINLRFMVLNGDSIAINSDYSVLFVIDKSVSMRALDYNGNNERVQGVIDDCCYIVDELSSCRFSIITFGNNAQRIIPFTNDTDMVQAELKAIAVEDDLYAKGSSMNLVKDVFEKTLKEENERKEGNAKFIVFFISDGEITKEDEKLESFSSIGQYIANGAVMGYGTEKGGKMVYSINEEDPTSDYYYIYYYDSDYNRITALSKIDEKNLKQIASDLKVDYIQMSKKSNIDYKLNDIKKQISNSQSNEEKISDYQDIYYYFAIPLAILLIIDFILKKKRM